MRRILLLMAVAALMTAMIVTSAMPAFAGSVNAKTDQTTGADPNDTNTLGAEQSAFTSAGGTDNNNPGTNPGSRHDPDTNFTNPETGEATWNGDFTSTVAQDPSLIGGSGHGVGQFQP